MFHDLNVKLVYFVHSHRPSSFCAMLFHFFSPTKCAFSLKTVSNMLREKPIKCSSDLTVCFFPLTGGMRARGWGNEDPPPPPLRVHGQTSQSIWENLVGTNKLIGLSSKYVFPPHASLWDYTHPEDAVSQAYKHKLTTAARPGQSKHPDSSCPVRYFLFEVWCSKFVVYVDFFLNASFNLGFLSLV